MRSQSMSLSTNEAMLLFIGGPIGLALAGLLLKAACDLCSVEPPPHLVRCLVIAIVLAAIGAPLGYGAYLLGKTLGPSDTLAALVAVLLFVPVFAVISTLIFMPSLRVRPLKGAKIWLVQTLINAVVGGVVVMLVIG